MPTAACCAPSPRPTASGGSRPTVDDVDPVYLALLKAYEDRRFDDHCGVDPLAAVRAAEQWIDARPHRVGRLDALHAGRAPARAAAAQDALPTKAIQSARALQLEWRYSKREVLAIYLTLAPMGGNLEGVRAASLRLFRQGAEATSPPPKPPCWSPSRNRPSAAGPIARRPRPRRRASACWRAACSTA